MIKKFIKRHKYLITFLIGILIISLIVGFIIYKNEPQKIKDSLILSLADLKQELVNNRLNNILEHILILLIISLLSISIIGYFSGLVYLFYEGLSISFTVSYLWQNYGLKGLLFGITYNIFFKLLYLISLIIILIKLFDIVKNIIGFIIYHQNNNLLNNFKHNFLSILLLIVGNLICDTVLYFFGNFILKILINML